MEDMGTCRGHGGDMGETEGTVVGVVGHMDHGNTEARDMKTQGTVASGRGGQWQEAVGASGIGDTRNRVWGHGDTRNRGMKTQGTAAGEHGSEGHEDTGDKNIGNRGRGEK